VPRKSQIPVTYEVQFVQNKKSSYFLQSSTKRSDWNFARIYRSTCKHLND